MAMRMLLVAREFLLEAVIFKRLRVAVVRIRIGIGFNQVCGYRSGSRRAKITHKNCKKLRFHVLKCWMFSFEG